MAALGATTVVPIDHAPLSHGATLPGCLHGMKHDEVRWDGVRINLFGRVGVGHAAMQCTCLTTSVSSVELWENVLACGLAGDVNPGELVVAGRRVAHGSATPSVAPPVR